MVNIKEMEETMDQILEEDSLFRMMDRQKELMEKYHQIEKETQPCVVPSQVPVSLNSREGQHQIKQRIHWCIEELAEAMGTLKNRPWKQTMMETDEDHFKEEMADALHFFLEACILAGISALELANLYFRKSEVNRFRQRSNY